MMFLLKMAFWLALILAFLPTFAGTNTSAGSNGVKIDPAEAVSAAADTVGDMKQFCSRQPGACSVGAQAATVFGQKAQAGIKIIYDYLSEQRKASSTTGQGVTSATARSATVRGTDTLTPDDLAPAWRAPASRKDISGKNST